MQITVLIKPVPDAEARLRADAPGRRLDPEGVKFVLSGYDESAVEQALLLKEAVPGSRVRVVSLGVSPRTDEILRAALALGADDATSVEGPPGGSDDPIVTARALALVLGRAPFDLVIGGKQAGDDEAGVVMAALAEALGLPEFGSVLDLRPAGSGRAVTFARSTEAGTERWEAPLPCVVGLQQAWNDPRTAKLPNILKSRKAPIARVAWSEIAAALGERAQPRSEPERFELPAPRSGAKMIAWKTPEEAAKALVRILREEAKVFP